MQVLSASEFDIGPKSQIPLGEGRNFDVGGTVIAVFRTHSDMVYATQPDCPHKQGPLADGLVGGTTVICPLHERAFNLETGEESGTECRLTIYPVNTTPEGSIVVLVK